MTLKQRLVAATLALTVGAGASANPTTKEENPLFGTHDYTQADGKKVSISTIRISSSQAQSGDPYAASNTLKTTISIDGKTSMTGVFVCAARINYGPQISAEQRASQQATATAHIDQLLPKSGPADQENRSTAIRVGGFVVLGNCIAGPLNAPSVSI